MNDTALVILDAIKAGLGEYRRNQMVLTPEFGPRVRFSKIFTSLPMALDSPRRLGITEYCNSCAKCAEAGFGCWTKLESDGAICMWVCRFNREYCGLQRFAFNLNQIEGKPRHYWRSAYCVLRLIEVNRIKRKTL